MNGTQRIQCWRQFVLLLSASNLMWLWRCLCSVFTSCMVVRSVMLLEVTGIHCTIFIYFIFGLVFSLEIPQCLTLRHFLKKVHQLDLTINYFFSLTGRIEGRYIKLYIKFSLNYWKISDVRLRKQAFPTESYLLPERFFPPKSTLTPQGSFALLTKPFIIIIIIV